RRILASIGRAIRACGLLVCADAAVAFERYAHAHRNLLGRDDRLRLAGLEFVATGHAGDLFCVLSLVRERGTGFFRLSVGWNAARSWLHLLILCAGRIPARVGRRKQAIARKLVPAGVGMFPYLL